MRIMTFTYSYSIMNIDWEKWLVHYLDKRIGTPTLTCFYIPVIPIKQISMLLNTIPYFVLKGPVSVPKKIYRWVQVIDGFG